MSSREEILESVNRMPQLPASSAQLIPLLQNSEADPEEICQAISLDPGLTAHVLRVANSAALGASDSIVTVRQALMRLGTGRVLGAVLSTVVGPVAMQPVTGYGLHAGSLWENCVAVALATEEFSEILGKSAPVEAFTAGLLCDIGKLVLGEFVAQDCGAIRELAFGHGLPFDQAEREILGVDHAEVGAALLRTWKLPEAIVEVVRWHHSPESCREECRELVDLVHLADYACLMGGIGGGDDGTSYMPSADVADRLGASVFDIEHGMCNTLCKLEEARELFGLLATRTQS